MDNEDLNVYATTDGDIGECLIFVFILLVRVFYLFICVYYSGRILICLKLDTKL